MKLTVPQASSSSSSARSPDAAQIATSTTAATTSCTKVAKKGSPRRRTARAFTAWKRPKPRPALAAHRTPVTALWHVGHVSPSKELQPLQVLLEPGLFLAGQRLERGSDRALRQPDERKPRLELGDGDDPPLEPRLAHPAVEGHTGRLQLAVDSPRLLDVPGVGCRGVVH